MTSIFQPAQPATSMQDVLDAKERRIAELEQAIAESSRNCPTCGRHDFGLWQGSADLSERIKALESELNERRDISAATLAEAAKDKLWYAQKLATANNDIYLLRADLAKLKRQVSDANRGAEVNAHVSRLTAENNANLTRMVDALCERISDAAEYAVDNSEVCSGCPAGFCGCVLTCAKSIREWAENKAKEGAL